MSANDLTLSNPLIKAFLEGSSEHVPVGELIYVHTHLISDNFLSEIETMINLAAEAIQLNPKKAKLGSKLIAATNELLLVLPTINEETAIRIMYVLRDVYKSCNRILEN